MRFTVGQNYVFARTIVEKGSEPRFFGPSYLPWSDTLLAIETVVLTCTEHHKVAWDQDPKGEKKYDGFLFKDQDGNTWENQYPTAAYGQLDDSADRRVRRYFTTEQLLVVGADGEVVKDAEGHSVKKPGSEKDWETFDSQFWNPFTLATELLGSVYRGIHSDKTERNKEEKESLSLFLDALTFEVEKSGKKVHFGPLSMERTDGTFLIADHYYVADLRESEKAAA